MAHVKVQIVKQNNLQFKIKNGVGIRIKFKHIYQKIAWFFFVFFLKIILIIKSNRLIIFIILYAGIQVQETESGQLYSSRVFVKKI